jgi:REP element-mobilizing transposase RayT
MEIAGCSAIVFVTVCAASRRPILARDDVHRLLRESWRMADAWIVGRYVVMPDHLHLFCAPASREAPSLSAWIAFWKSTASRRWPRAEEQPVWQASYWDRQLRAAESYSEKWGYVRANPVRAGLVSDAEAWPFAGELNAFRFREAK